MAERPLEGRRVLVTGGSSPTGLAIAVEVYKRGAKVYIGTRSKERFRRDVTPVFQTAVPDFDGVGFYPFVADFSVPGGPEAAYTRLSKPPTDIVHAAVGGMEPDFLVTARRLILARIKLGTVGTERLEALKAYEEECDERVWRDMPYFFNTNYEHPRRFVNFIWEQRAEAKDVMQFVDITSLWSSFVFKVRPPHFYRGIADTKGSFEGWLTGATPSLMKRGIYPAVVSGHVIGDTEVGRAIDGLVAPLVPEEQLMAIRAGYILRDDMVQATLMMLESDPREWKKQPRKLFVCGPDGQISEHFTPDPQSLRPGIPVGNKVGYL